jgi:hypothetical protein
VGLAFLGTISKDGGPRLHPVCPLLTEDELYVFVVPSPTRADLRRNGRYALHSFPTDDNEDACYLTGRAVEVEEEPERTRLAEQYAAERSQFGTTVEELDLQTLFRLDLERVLITRTTGHGDPDPQHEIWTP